MNPEHMSPDDAKVLQARVKAIQSRLGWIRLANLLLPISYLPMIGVLLHRLSFDFLSSLPFMLLAILAHILIATRFWEVPR